MASKLLIFLYSCIFLLLYSHPVSAQTYLYPGTSWITATPAEVGMDAAKLTTAKNYASAYGGAGMITRGGKLVMSWGTLSQKYDIKSSTKSFGATALGLAIQDGKLTLQTKGQSCQPSLGVPPDSNKATGWLPNIPLSHLATQRAGFDKSGGYTALLFAPGTQWSYSDGGPNWLAECITLTYQQDLLTLMRSRVFDPIGIPTTELNWRSNIYRDDYIQGIKNREFGAGISTTVNGLARLGYLYLRQGKWINTQIIPSTFVDAARVNQAGSVPIYANRTGYTNASKHYGLLWWNNADKAMPNVPADTYWSWGLYESLTVVIPSLDIVASRLGQSFPAAPNSDPFNSIEQFIEPIALSVISGPTPTPTPTPVPGDINLDGAVNQDDYTMLSNSYNTADPSADINADGIVNLLDLPLLSNNFANPLP